VVERRLLPACKKEMKRTIDERIVGACKALADATGPAPRRNN
jgi:hypothetical protein